MPLSVVISYSFISFADGLSSHLVKDSIIDLLLEHKADVNKCKKGDDSPLLMAIKEKHFVAVEKLIKAGANPAYQGASKQDAFEKSLNLGKYHVQYRFNY